MVALEVVVQAGFQVMVLALEADGVVDFLHVGQGELAPDAVLGRPDDAAIASGEFPGRAQVVELVVTNLRAATVAGGPGLGAVCGLGVLAKARLRVVGGRGLGGGQTAM